MSTSYSERDDFLNKYRISTDAFRDSKISWNNLLDIKKDFESKKSKYENALEQCRLKLCECPQIHSLNTRVKDPEHLIEKVIRKNPDFLKKKAKSGGGSITVDNYERRIKDLAGFRIVLLYKDDWPIVHDYIVNQFKRFNETPFAYVVKGDNEQIYKDKNVRVKHRNDYRSVHYVVRVKGCLIELQVRTLAEEVWGEIDHDLRYPYSKKNEKLSRYMALMSDLTGCVDRMATFVSYYLKDFEKSSNPPTRNEVYNKVLEKIDRIQGEENESVKKEIKDLILSAEEFQILKDTKDLFFSIVG